jgi:hypothetical protein
MLAGFLAVIVLTVVISLVTYGLHRSNKPRLEVTRSRARA